MKTRALKTLLATTGLSTLMLGAVANAEPVTLETLDKSVSIAGDLLEFDGQTYVVRTAIGTVSIATDFVTCGGPGCPEAEPDDSQFSIAGSRSLTDELIPALVNGYGQSVGADLMKEIQNGNSTTYEVSTGERGTAEIKIDPSNTRDGLQSLLDANATFALATRPARNREVEAFAENNLGDLRSPGQEHIVALDGLVLVTHPENPVRAVSEINAALAFGGQITNWSELGGRNGPINLYVREADSGTREVFDALLMRPNGLTVNGNITILESDAEITEAVKNDPNGFGFTSFAKADDAAALAIEGVCGLRTPPTAFTIKTEEYPLTRLLYMYNTDDQLPFHARDFLDYISTEDGQQLVSNAGFIDQTVSSETINSQGIRVASAVVNNETPEELVSMRNMFELLLAADRLSTTFRFETGSARLDSRAEADVERLAELLSSPRFSNKEVLFVGFTDSVGRADLNELLSQQRAELVRRSVLAANPDLNTSTQTRAIGFGEVSPLGCNETDTGRRINRRVEVWVQDVVAGDRT